MQSRPLSLIVVILVSLLTTPLMARRFILDASPSDVPNIASQYGLTVVKQIPNRSVFLVTAADEVDQNQLVSQLSSDPRVAVFEVDGFVNAPEESPTVSLNQSTAALLDGLSGMTAVSYYGSPAPSNYVSQPATQLTRLADAQARFGV